MLFFFFGHHSILSVEDILTIYHVWMLGRMMAMGWEWHELEWALLHHQDGKMNGGFFFFSLPCLTLFLSLLGEKMTE